MTIDLATINFIPGKGGGVIKSLSVTSNGVYSVPAGVDGYNPVDVDVHPSESLQRTYTSNGIYNIPGEWNGVEIEVNTPVPSGVMNITSNGVYDVVSFASASVNVPSPEFVTEPLNITSNGTYTPGQGVDGFSTVTVDVPQSVTGYTEKDITEGILNNIVNLNNSASFVATSAFEGKNIQTVNLAYAKFTQYNAFRNCESLIQVNLPMCSSLGTNTFINCLKLSQVSLPMCSYIGNNVFNYCLKLSQVSLPMCSYIGSYVFTQCSSLTQVSLPMCSYIGNDAFISCRSLQEITVGTELYTVCVLGNSNTFYRCTALTSIYVPASLVESYKTATNWTYYSDKIVGI